MRLIKYLTEGTPIEEVMRTVESKCQPFLRDFRKFKWEEFLYSGRTNDTQPVIQKKIRTDRMPLTINTGLHNRLDMMFYKKFKLKPRSGSLFCITDADDAESYGHVYIVFPEGPYKVIYSPSVGDLFVEISQRGIDKAYNKAKTKEDLIPVDKMIEKIVNGYKINDLKGAIQSGNEIMIMARSWIGLKLNDYQLQVEEYFDI